MKKCDAALAKRLILWGIPVISVLGSLTHFIYDWTGKITAVGLLAPVNESVWEHMKLTVWPMIIWWFLFYFLFFRKCDFKANWLAAAAAAIISGPIVMLTLFYTYTGALGIESLIVDIAIMVAAVVVGQLLGLHFFKRGSFGRACAIVSVVIIVLFVVMFAIFTLYPPHLPVFFDTEGGFYGIK